MNVPVKTGKQGGQDSIDSKKSTPVEDVAAIVTDLDNLVKEIPAVASNAIANLYADVAKNLKENTNKNNQIKAFADVMQEAGKYIKTMDEKATSVITAFLQSDNLDKATELFSDFSEWICDYSEKDFFEFLRFADFLENFDVLSPFAQQEIDRLRKKQNIKNFTFQEFLRDKDPKTGKTIQSLFAICVEKAISSQKISEKRLFELQLLSQEMPILKSILPTRYVMPNNPIANSLAGRKPKEGNELVQIVNAGAFDLPVLNSDKKSEVTAYTMVTFEPGSNVTMTGKPFTQYDRCILNSVISLWEAGNTTITPEMICRAMANKTESEKITPQQQGAVTKSLEKMRYIHVFADLTEEMRKRKVKINDEPIGQFQIDNFLLLMDKIKVSAGGTTKIAYHIIKEPILLTYSKMTGQLLTVKSALLDIKKIKDGKISTETIPTTENRQPIKEYLLQRIEVMKYDRKNKHSNQSNRILFDSLYRDTGTVTPNRVELKRIREYAFQVLDYWKASHYIIDYESVADGRKIKGVDIIF